MFAIISHDLRAPIILVKSLLNPVVIRSFEKEQLAEHIDHIKSRIGVVQDTMNGLLTWANSQMGKATVNKEMIDVHDELRSVIRSFDDMVELKQIDVLISGADGIKVFVDKNHFIIVIRNIFHNALKYTNKEGQVYLSVSSIDDGVAIAIEDSGAGISDEQKLKILNNESVSSNKGTDGQKGTGFGLKFCQGLIRQNGGKLTIHNRESGGSIFTVSLPIGKKPLM